MASSEGVRLELDDGYEIETEIDVDAEQVEVTEDSMDNGEEEEATTEQIPIVVAPATDPEDDEHDVVAMPTSRVVMLDLAEVNKNRRLIIKSMTFEDLNNPKMKALIRNSGCTDVNLQYVRRTDGAKDLTGMMCITFPSAKVMSTYMLAVRSIRKDIVVETPQATETSSSIIDNWKKGHAVAAESLPSALVIVKNLDAATATIEKLAELFPDAEDITISSQPRASYLGKLKGTKHAFMTYANLDQANTAVDLSVKEPIELDGRILIVSLYKEPPNNVPEGYMRLTTRKLVLTQRAKARGLIARAQEDPTYTLGAHWHQWLEKATELLEKDDAARDALHLPKPSLADFKNIKMKYVPLERSAVATLHHLGVGEAPPSADKSAAKKRPFSGPAKSEPTPKASQRGKSGPGRPPSLFRSSFGRSRPPTPTMSMRPSRSYGPRGYGVDSYNYDSFGPRMGGMRLPSPAMRLAAMQAARERRLAAMSADYLGW